MILAKSSAIKSYQFYWKPLKSYISKIWHSLDKWGKSWLRTGSLDILPCHIFAFGVLAISLGMLLRMKPKLKKVTGLERSHMRCLTPHQHRIQGTEVRDRFPVSRLLNFASSFRCYQVESLSGKRWNRQSYQSPKWATRWNVGMGIPGFWWTFICHPYGFPWISSAKSLRQPWNHTKNPETWVAW